MKCKKNKYILIISFLVYILLLSVSCSNPNSVIMEDSYFNLKKIAAEYKKGITWSEEIEKDRLKQKIPSVEGMEKSINITPFTILASKNEENYKKIYPEISGFSYLDTSMLPSEVLEILDNFCSAIIEDAETETYVNQDTMYTLVIFLYDLEKNKIKFSSYVAGLPFSEDETYYECPVRFYLALENENGTDTASAYDPFMDVDILITKEKDVWKINQIVYDIEN